MSCGVGPLIESLVSAVDGAREIASELGLRPHRVVLVWSGWTTRDEPSVPVVRDGMEPDHALEAFSRLDLSADTVGVGKQILLYEHELSPRPRVSFSTSRDADAVGITERGTIRVDRISMRYPEDVFSGLVVPFRDASGERLLPGVDFWWEVRDDRERGFAVPGFEGVRAARHELAPVRRRFHLVGIEGRNAGAVEWAVTLRRADGERDRGGAF